MLNVKRQTSLDAQATRLYCFRIILFFFYLFSSLYYIWVPIDFRFGKMSSKSWICNCSKGFKSKYTLIRHQKSVCQNKGNIYAYSARNLLWLLVMFHSCLYLSRLSLYYFYYFSSRGNPISSDSSKWWASKQRQINYFNCSGQCEFLKFSNKFSFLFQILTTSICISSSK